MFIDFAVRKWLAQDRKRHIILCKMANTMVKDSLSQADVILLNKEKEAGGKRQPRDSKKGKDPVVSKTPAPTSAKGPATSAGGASSKPSQQQVVNPVVFNAEVAGILKELNDNQHKISDKLESLSSRVDTLYEYPYEYEQGEQSEQYEAHVYENADLENLDPELSLEVSSVVSEISEPPNKKQKTDSIFKNISEKFNPKEQVDSEINEELAEFINSAFIDGITDVKQTDLTKGINRPNNCTALVKTKVNQPIWRLLKPHTQTDDSKMQTIQNNVIKAATNFTKILNECGDTMGQNMVDMGTDALALLGQSNKLINNKRKEFHKTDLDVRYHYLTSSSLAYTDKLYGDEVNKNIKEIQDINRLGRNIGRGFTGASRGGFRGRRPFRYSTPGRGRARGRGYGRGGMDHQHNYNFGGSNYGAASKNGKTGAKK